METKLDNEEDVIAWVERSYGPDVKTAYEEARAKDWSLSSAALLERALDAHHRKLAAECNALLNATFNSDELFADEVVAIADSISIPTNDMAEWVEAAFGSEIRSQFDHIDKGQPCLTPVAKLVAAFDGYREQQQSLHDLFLSTTFNSDEVFF